MRRVALRIRTVGAQGATSVHTQPAPDSKYEILDTPVHQALQIRLLLPHIFANKFWKEKRNKRRRRLYIIMLLYKKDCCRRWHDKWPKSSRYVWEIYKKL